MINFLGIALIAAAVLIPVALVGVLIFVLVKNKK